MEAQNLEAGRIGIDKIRTHGQVEPISFFIHVEAKNIK